MEIADVYIPENLQLNEGSIDSIYELQIELSGRMFIHDIDIKEELIKKAKELKEPKIAKFLEAI